ncbi:hypothetical protein SAMN05216199_2642 [Pedococcus cremeus]|uniref:Uncharacterized protein n=1 Tax=Pedococcus cremeus TaxID=587636 RepID=A0A1H9VY58_9MICO|nr:DUF6498-containing protein [Pedococcus cremeus]SES26468.1 hypothetical protein SAMN05216199_2642 [Pedococcus cremeus]
MNTLLRVLGLQLAHTALQRVSPRAARAVSIALVLTACLTPLVALLGGEWASGDVLLSYLFELYAVLFWTVVRVVTAPGPLLSAGTVSTNGGPPVAMSRSELVEVSWLLVGVLVAFTVVQSVVAFHVAGSAGLRAGPWALAAMAAGFFASHGFDVALRWFALGDRHRASDLASDPLKRFVILQIALGLGAAWTFSARTGLAPEAAKDSAWLLLVPGLVLVVVRIALELYAVVRPPVQWGSAQTRLT